MRNRIRLKLLAAALAWASMPVLTHAEDPVQIYQEARNADPTLAIADANKGAINEGIDQARSALLPQISASLGYNRLDGATNNIGPVQDFASGNFVLLPNSDTVANRSRPGQIQLSQSLFNWTNWTRLESSRATALSADSNYDAASQDLFVRTSTAYFGVLTSQDALTFAQANEKALARQLDQAEQRFEVGLSAITDVHNARANHDSSVAQVIQAQNTLDNAREALSQMIVKEFGDLKKLREQLPLEKPSPGDVQSWVDVAVKQNPTLASAQHSLEAAEYNISSARSGPYPTLSASVVRNDTPGWGDTTQGFAGNFYGPFHGNTINGSTTIGVTLNVAIYTGGLVSSQV